MPKGFDNCVIFKTIGTYVEVGHYDELSEVRNILTTYVFKSLLFETNVKLKILPDTGEIQLARREDTSIALIHS